MHVCLYLPSGIVYIFKTFTWLVVCHRALSLFSDYIEKIPSHCGCHATTHFVSEVVHPRCCLYWFYWVVLWACFPSSTWYGKWYFAKWGSYGRDGLNVSTNPPSIFFPTWIKYFTLDHHLPVLVEVRSLCTVIENWWLMTDFFKIAIFPLMAGAIFDAQGISNFTYVSVPVAAAMALVWALFPSRIPGRKVNHF